MASENVVFKFEARGNITQQIRQINSALKALKMTSEQVQAGLPNTIKRGEEAKNLLYLKGQAQQVKALVREYERSYGKLGTRKNIQGSQPVPADQVAFTRYQTQSAKINKSRNVKYSDLPLPTSLESIAKQQKHLSSLQRGGLSAGGDKDVTTRLIQLEKRYVAIKKKSNDVVKTANVISKKEAKVTADVSKSTHLKANATVKATKATSGYASAIDDLERELSKVNAAIIDNKKLGNKPVSSNVLAAQVKETKKLAAANKKVQKELLTTYEKRERQIDRFTKRLHKLEAKEIKYQKTLKKGTRVSASNTATQKKRSKTISHLTAEIDRLTRSQVKNNEIKASRSNWFSGIASSAKGFIAGAIGYQVTRGAVSGLINIFDAAADLEEQLQKLSVVFGNNAEVMTEFANELKDDWNLSMQEAAYSVARVGGVIVGLNFDLDETAKLTRQVLKMASDLASVNNEELHVAITAITRGLVNEREMLKRLGITLTDDIIKRRLQAKGLGDLTGQARQQALAMETLTFIIQAQSHAWGDLERTYFSTQNTTRRIKSNVADVGTFLGSQLKLIIRPLLTFLDAMTSGTGAIKDSLILKVITKMTKMLVHLSGTFVGIINRIDLMFSKLIGGFDRLAIKIKKAGALAKLAALESGLYRPKNKAEQIKAGKENIKGLDREEAVLKIESKQYRLIDDYIKYYNKLYLNELRLLESQDDINDKKQRGLNITQKELEAHEKLEQLVKRMLSRDVDELNIRNKNLSNELHPDDKGKAKESRFRLLSRVSPGTVTNKTQLELYKNNRDPANLHTDGSWDSSVAIKKELSKDIESIEAELFKKFLVIVNDDNKNKQQKLDLLKDLEAKLLEIYTKATKKKGNELLDIAIEGEAGKEPIPEGTIKPDLTKSSYLNKYHPYEDTIVPDEAVVGANKEKVGGIAEQIIQQATANALAEALKLLNEKGSGGGGTTREVIYNWFQELHNTIMNAAQNISSSISNIIETEYNKIIGMLDETDRGLKKQADNIRATLEDTQSWREADADQRRIIEADALADLNKIQAKNDAERYKIEKAAFEKRKELEIANVWIGLAGSIAQATFAAVVQSAAFPLLAPVIWAQFGIGTALATAAAGAQTAAIASKNWTPPTATKLAMGGRLGAGQTAVVGDSPKQGVITGYEELITPASAATVHSAPKVRDFINKAVDSRMQNSNNRSSINNYQFDIHVASAEDGFNQIQTLKRKYGESIYAKNN